ncbi:pyruvate formate lyase activating enzyme [Geosporobacter subterraneus DSM 17957]|uniref:Pyruvate formate-lyase-activating enzyme n=1 Tax=Geosporobacter subterraneus DSM 17957 TaxID=1121919 RepID=A0A1M6II99_9FIRM|nr:pyruvate formate-lyase-activating protein [Geosporobacter subterraneus]SHJ34134.1 pyruvate formate lyase activating enzyme [Geosporobacter subterraneus DSM 17957]
MPSQARVHSIETCGTVDGPGIRYILFLAGCPLRCKYCHNCDTWKKNVGELMTVEEIIADVIKYKPYFKFSKGGITVSGGEPTLQWQVLGELFKLCKAEEIHTCLDTSGYCDLDKGEAFLPYTDLVLLDIKHIDNEKHKALTGVENHKTLAFARHLRDRNIPVWIRYVVVPGYSDDPLDIEKLCRFLKTLDNIQRVELLPYHKMGISKWQEMGLAYELEHVDPPTEDQMKRIRKIFEEYGIQTY